MKELLFGILGALLGAVALFVGGNSFGWFSKEISDSQLQEVSRLVVDEPKLRSTLLSKMKESGNFVGPKGETGKQGAQGPRGPSGPVGPSVWPSGSYCILRGKSACPGGFSQVDANISAISTYSFANGYIGAAAFGSSAIGVHNGGKSPNWFGDLKLSVCCK